MMTEDIPWFRQGYLSILRKNAAMQHDPVLRNCESDSQ